MSATRTWACAPDGHHALQHHQRMRGQ
jgi:hypothetical protein